MQRFIHRQLGGAVCVAAVCALIGCSEDSSPSADTTGGVDLASIRACELLTPEEIEAATGIGADAGQDIGFAGSVPMCNWPQTGSDFDMVVTLIVTPAAYRSYEEFRASARDNAFGDLLADTDVEAVDVAGADFGVWMPEAGTLQVYGSGFMVQVTAETAAGRDEFDASRVLAQAAGARLR
jgi:hypothetical protein